MPSPTIDGLYAAEIYAGWKLLTWERGRWQDEHGHFWPDDVPQWVGPLPERVYFPVEDPPLKED
jgi:hypothetical protein